MPALSEYSNVNNTALSLIKRKGFNVWYDDEGDLFCAEQNGWDFYADSPCGLLGLISIFEHKKPKAYTEYWWRLEGEDLLSSISKEAPIYESVVENKKNIPDC